MFNVRLLASTESKTPSVLGHVASISPYSEEPSGPLNFVTLGLLDVIDTSVTAHTSGSLKAFQSDVRNGNSSSSMPRLTITLLHGKIQANVFYKL